MARLYDDINKQPVILPIVHGTSERDYFIGIVDKYYMATFFKCTTNFIRTPPGPAHLLK